MAKNSGNIDWLILLAVVALMLFSVAFVYSASSAVASAKFGSSEKLFWNHAFRVLGALVIMIVMAKIDYHHIREFTRPLMVVAILFLLYVFVGGDKAKGAVRWVHFGFINFQPSELAKFAILIHISRILSDKKEKVLSFKEGLIPPLVWMGIVCGLIALQPNLSTAFVIFMLSFSLLFLSGAKVWQLAGLGIVGFVMAAIYAIGAEYRLNRLLAYINAPGSEDSPVNYQLQQALIAFGNGGIVGVGPGQSYQRDLFLPEPFGDFIFSIVGEEYGYTGVLAVVMVFVIILWRGIIAARTAKDSFGFFLASGITLTLSVYAFVNAGVTCGILPTTGLPMPFISYGGTSVIFSAAAVGILLNVSSQKK
ncbi:MAG: putative peptidoglycan glycosyltransferase FtsW [Candidatus Kapaibacterium sp.]|nr:putative lipid II flippase FtsW [Bacteroidota bacterium]